MDASREKELARVLVEAQRLSSIERAEIEGDKFSGPAIAAAVLEKFLESGFFPKDLKPKLDFEGGLLERVKDNKFRLHWKRQVRPLEYETKPPLDFESAEEAATAYVQKQYEKGIGGLALEWPKVETKKKKRFFTPEKIAAGKRILKTLVIWSLIFYYLYSYVQNRRAHVFIHKTTTTPYVVLHDIEIGEFGPNLFLDLILSNNEKAFRQSNATTQKELKHRKQLYVFYWPLIQSELLPRRLLGWRWPFSAEDKENP